MFASCSDCTGVSGISSGIDEGGVINRSGSRGDSSTAASLEGLIWKISGCPIFVVLPSPFGSVTPVLASAIGVLDRSSADFDFPHKPSKVDEQGTDFLAGLRFLDFFVAGSGSSMLPERERGVDCLSEAVVMVFVGSLVVRRACSFEKLTRREEFEMKLAYDQFSKRCRLSRKNMEINHNSISRQVN